MNTSISDTNSYTDICELVVKDNKIFKVFKSMPDYRNILEHVTYEEGKEYADFALVNPLIKRNITRFQCNDAFGSPQTFQYDFGIFSPTTLRYLKVLSDLSQLKLDNISIVEIGGGYGGQYTVLRQLFEPKQYTFIDLQAPLKLIQKYTNALGLDDIPLEFIESKDLKIIESDLVISNYAVSECNKETQDLYLDKIINHCKHGYMTYNNFNGYSHQEFISRCNIPVKVFNEQPQTGPKNVLLTW